MNKGEWTFLSNHGRVLIYLAKHPSSTTQELAQKASLSIRAIQNIIDDLEEGGYITRYKEGRKNCYTVNPALPMRHRLEKEFPVKEILLALGYDPNTSNSG
jgi:DNA-binding MarR family transcriptional regulator